MGKFNFPWDETVPWEIYIPMGIKKFPWDFVKVPWEFVKVPWEKNNPMGKFYFPWENLISHGNFHL